MQSAQAASHAGAWNHSYLGLPKLPQSALGVVQAEFDCTEWHCGDAGDFFERKIFEHVEQKRRALNGGYVECLKSKKVQSR